MSPRKQSSPGEAGDKPRAATEQERAKQALARVRAERAAKRLSDELEPTEPEAIWARIAVLAERLDKTEPIASELVRRIASSAGQCHREARDVEKAHESEASQAELSGSTREAFLARRTKQSESIMTHLRERVASDCQRALAALLCVTPHREGEEALTLGSHLRAAAGPLRPDILAVCDPDARHEQDRTALEGARRDGRVAHLPDDELLNILRRFAVPRNEQFGPGRAVQDGLSADEEARILREILQPESNSASALAKAMQRAKRAREAHFLGPTTADTKCPERLSTGDSMVSACSPLQNKEPDSVTESADMVSRPSLRPSASRRAR